MDDKTRDPSYGQRPRAGEHSPAGTIAQATERAKAIEEQQRENEKRSRDFREQVQAREEAAANRKKLEEKKEARKKARQEAKDRSEQLKEEGVKAKRSSKNQKTAPLKKAQSLAQNTKKILSKPVKLGKKLKPNKPSTAKEENETAGVIGFILLAIIFWGISENWIITIVLGFIGYWLFAHYYKIIIWTGATIFILWIIVLFNSDGSVNNKQDRISKEKRTMALREKMNREFQEKMNKSQPSTKNYTITPQTTTIRNIPTKSYAQLAVAWAKVLAVNDFNSNLIIDTIRNDEVVQVLSGNPSHRENMVEIKYKNQIGFIHKNYLMPVENGSFAQVNTPELSGLRFRKSKQIRNDNYVTGSPIPHLSIIEVLEYGGPSEIISGDKGSWIKVLYKGKEGYVFDYFVTYLSDD